MENEKVPTTVFSQTITLMKDEEMTYFIREFNRIKEICFSNQIQIDIATNTERYLDSNFDQDINLNLLAHLRFTSKYHLISTEAIFNK